MITPQKVSDQQAIAWSSAYFARDAYERGEFEVAALWQEIARQDYAEARRLRCIVEVPALYE